MNQAFSSLVTALLLFSATAFSAPTPKDLAGNWNGTLETGSVKLRLLFKISKVSGGGFTAKMDSLDQGALDIPVDSVNLTDDTLRMEIKSIQGVYVGTMNQGWTKATGQWQQGPQSLPLVLERSSGTNNTVSSPAPSPADLAASKSAAQKLAGTWNGTLAVGATNLRLVVNISKATSGAASGTMDSTDQGAKNIPLSAITLKDGKFRFEAPGIGGAYEGTLAADGVNLAGQWHQGGQAIPLDLKKAPAAK